MMTLRYENYLKQQQHWPSAGRHILAQYDNQSVIVYQAYSPAIGNFAASEGYFGGPFRLNRMSWIKPNFLWMMYRSGWGQKSGQEVTLAIHLRSEAFEEILNQAVHSTYVPELYGDRVLWQRQLKQSNVRLQWDPDHAPGGGKLERRAIQLGLRGSVLEKYAREWIVQIEDISQFVLEQRLHVARQDHLLTPRERAYIPQQQKTRQRLGICEPQGK